MSTATLVRSWTDEQFRASIAELELEFAHPAGSIDDELAEINAAFESPLSTSTSPHISRWTSRPNCCC